MNLNPSLDQSHGDHDDEFDDLFSFSIASPSKNNGIDAPTSSTRVSGNTTNANTTRTTTRICDSSSSSSSSNLSEESYHKVKVQTPSGSSAAEATAMTLKNAVATSNNDDDDIFGDFDLNLDTIANKSISTKTATSAATNEEEDFNGMDEGTREFLDFLDQDSAMDDEKKEKSSSSDIHINKADDILAGLALDDSDSDVDSDDEKQQQTDKSTINFSHAPERTDQQTQEVSPSIDINDGNDVNQDDNGYLSSKDNGNAINLTVMEDDSELSNKNETTTHNGTNHTVDKEKKENSDVNTANIIEKEKGQQQLQHLQPQPDKRNQTHTLASAEQTSMYTTSSPKIPIAPGDISSQTSVSSIQGGSSILASIDMEEPRKFDGALEDHDIGDQGNDTSNEKGINKSFSIDGDDDDDDDDLSDNEKEEQMKDMKGEQKVLRFESLLEALRSAESTIEHIHPFIYTYKSSNPYHQNRNTDMHSSSITHTHSQRQAPSNYITPISKEDRPYLWSKVICSKTLSDVQSSSLVDSFLDWRLQKFDYGKFVCKDEVYGLDTEFVDRLLKEVNVLSLRIVDGMEGDSSINNPNGNFQLQEEEDGDDYDKEKIVKAKEELCSLLVFYYRSTLKRSSHKIKSFASILRKADRSNDDDITAAAGEQKEENEQNDRGIDGNKETSSRNESTENSMSINDGKNQGDNDTESVDEKKVAKELLNEAEKGKDDKKESAARDEAPKIDHKPLLGPIAATLLSAGVPVEVASVMLSRIISKLPLISLTKLEQHTAVKSLHQQLYFLACYHLPLLVLHLDRYAPGWHWPRVYFLDEYSEQSKTDSLSVTERGRNLQEHGTIPVTWFASLLAGEGISKTLEQVKLLPLWDILLTSNDQSLKFFLALATLEKHSDSLMMLRGQDLIDELSSVMSSNSLLNVGDESFLDNQNGDISKDEEFVLNWFHDAKQLQEATPISVTLDLSKAEDVAVNHILTMRSKIAMEEMTARLEAEAEAHRKAMEIENARKAEARQYEHYKKRLERFYDKYCPEKKATVNNILDAYKDNYLLLDHKLQKKYGSGFLPMMATFNPNITNKTNKFVSHLGQGIESRKKNIVAKRAKERAEKLDEDMMGPGVHQVAAKVSASEILPFVCGGPKNSASHAPLKFYLVDSRPNETIQEQGAFPTAVRLSPEDIMDPDKIQEKVDLFESLRGAIHICIMGEGFSSLPTLYEHPLTKVEEKLLNNDRARTNMCALFFIKKGFPFISVLDGGFAAAHAWIARDCDYLTLNQVLIDYDEKTSLFADLERLYQEHKEFSSASTRKKTTLALQKLMDNSMTRLTMLENRIEEFTDRPRGRNNSTQNQNSDTEASEKPASKGNDAQRTFGSKTAKMPPMRLFGSGKYSNNAENALNSIDSVKSDDKKEVSTAPKDNSDESRTVKVDAVKSGFNKAFSGLKQIRVSRVPKDRNVDEVTGDAIGFPTKRKEETTNENDNHSHKSQGFNFGKLNFGNKKNNIFNRKGKQSNHNDDDLEKEIEASLTRPEDNDGNQVKGLQTKEKHDGKKTTATRQFVNPLNKFGSIKLKKNTATSIIREEESLFFDEESLGDTEDTLSFQTNNDMSANSD